MLDADWNEIMERSVPKRNLIRSLQAIGLMVAYLGFSFIYKDLYGTDSKGAWHWVLAAIMFSCGIGSAVMAILAFRSTVKSLRTNKKFRNYLALILSSLIIMLYIFWILQFAYFLYRLSVLRQGLPH
jgi:hypothetical protein